MRLLPSRISRYVFAELIPPTFLGLALYLFVLLMNHFFIVAEKALSKNLGFDLTFQLFIVGIPRMLVLSIPMSVLLGVLIAVGRLSADQEWVAMQSAGIGPGRLIRPIALFGATASLLTMFVYGWVVPHSNFVMRNLRGQVLFASNMAADLKPRVFYTDLPDVVLYVADIVTDSDRPLRQVLLVDRTQPDATELLLSREGNIFPSSDGSGNLTIELFEGLSHRWNVGDPEDYQFIAFKTRTQTVRMADHLKAFLAPPRKVVNDFTSIELLDEIRSAKEQLARVTAEVADQGNQGVNRLFVIESRVRSARLEFHRRLALPSASFVLALLALPLGVTRARSGKGAGFALSIAVIVGYWSIFTFTMNQATAGNLSVPVGAWAANVLVVTWAVIALWRMRRARPEIGPVKRLILFLLRTVIHGVRVARSWVSRSPGDTLDAEPDLQDLETLRGTTTRFVGRLDQYVSMSYLRVLLFSVLSVYSIFILVQVKGLMDDALKNDQPLVLILDYLRYFAPGTLFIVLPISCLVGGTVTFSLLTRSGELTAIKASGTSMRRITVPVLTITAMLCVALFLVNDRIAPNTNRRAQEVKDQIEGRGPRSYGISTTSGRWIIDPERQQLYYYRYYDPQEETFRELTVFTVDRDVPRIMDHRFAKSARWTGETWELGNGWFREFPEDPSGPVQYHRNTGVEVVEMAPPETFTSKVIRLSRLGDLAEQMSTSQLRREIESMEASGYNSTRLRMDYHSKFAFPFAPLVMVLLGLPFAFKVGRRGSLYGVGVALLLALVYWAAFAIFNALGLEGILDPLVAAWTPNILFGLTGIYLMLYIRT